MTLLNMILAQVAAPVEGAAQQVADSVGNAVADTAAAAASTATTISVAPQAAQAAQAAQPIVNDLSVWDLTMAGGSMYWRVPLTASASPHRCAQPQGATSDSSSALVAYPYEHIIWACNEQDPPSSREGLS